MVVIETLKQAYIITKNIESIPSVPTTLTYFFTVELFAGVKEAQHKAKNLIIEL